MTERQSRSGFDGQARAVLIGGTLLILVSFITNYGDHNLLRFTHLALHEQVGVFLHLAAMAALVGVYEVFSEGVVELAYRLRDRAFLLSGTSRNRLQLNEALAALQCGA